MTSRYQTLMTRLENGERILIDGATGTEIEQRGVPMIKNGWNGGGALTHPDIVRQVHEDYMRIGAEVVISNTFSTSRFVLQDAGLADHFDFLNRRGVELVVEARENVGRDSILAAGGITTLRFTDEALHLAQLRDDLDAQAAVMAAAGADLIMLEMMWDVERTHIALDAAAAAGLPVWVGLSCQPNEAGEMYLLDGKTPLATSLTILKERDVPLVNIMHTEVEFIDDCLKIVRDHWDRPFGVYAHSGRFVDPNWIFTDTISPDDYAASAVGWAAQGAQVIGGCCGIGYRHMVVLKKMFDQSGDLAFE